MASSIFITPILQSLLLLILSFIISSTSFSCINTEKYALLRLKAGFTDPLDRLSSWVVSEDCCTWEGVICSNETGHVIMLNLQNSHTVNFNDYGEEEGEQDYALGGNLSNSLLNLKALQHLDLSKNNFEGNPIPEFIGLIGTLTYLNLSGASFGGTVPKSFKNLVNLRVLDLSMCFSDFIENDLNWVNSISSLKYLNLGYIDLSKAANNWLQAINKLPNLIELRLPSCGLSLLPSSSPLPFINFTAVSILDLSKNIFESVIPSWLFNLTSLVYLDLSSSNLQGELSNDFGKLIHLQHLDLSKNYDIEGKLSKSWGNLCNLKQLILSQNNISGEIIEFIDELSTCKNISSIEFLDLGYNKLSGFLPNSIGHMRKLKYLHLWVNSFVGSIPDSIGNLSDLKTINLSKNQMKTIPESLGQLSALETLDLSGNSWEGVLTEAHFSNLTSLKEFYISRKDYSQNDTLIFNVSSNWIPPFKLGYLTIGKCKVGPKFPNWLRTQNKLTALSINKASIKDAIPDWFCEMDLSLSDLDFSENALYGRVPNLFKFVNQGYVDLSSNRFEGPFPLFSSNVTLLYLRDNYFSGPLPRDIGKKMPNLANFDVSYNLLNGTIPLSIGDLAFLLNIVLSNNNFTGEIPLIWYDKTSVYIVDLSSNKLSGRIPESMGLLTSLMFLALSNNNLTGDIPSSLQNCTVIQSLDLGENKLSGTIPAWIGEKMPSMLILRLRSNYFTGIITSQLCMLSSLHILDIAENLLIGTIPSCVGNLTGMGSDLSSVRYEGQLIVASKGREFLYDNTLYLVNSIDLSSNKLTGEMPQNLTNLSRLGTFNLSFNNLIGEIPEDIGNLQRLETLDLRRNQMSGEIPASMASLISLNHLNLSYNNFSGRIPTNNQFQTLTDPSIYNNNLALCGPPLTKKCSTDEPSPGINDKEDEDDGWSDKVWFYVSIGPGFAVGFWGVCGTLIIKKSWRFAYFKFFDGLKDRLC